MFFVYVLESLQDGKTYVGYTRDIQKRLKEHNSGKVHATRHRKPFKLLYVERSGSLKSAKKRELYWKSGGRRRLRYYFTNGFPPIAMGEARPA